MLNLYDEGIVIEEDWSWPVSIIQISENGTGIFWAVWCAKERNCNCTNPIGIGIDKHSALESWRFKHFVESARLEPRRRKATGG